MFRKAKNSGLIKGLVPHIVTNGICILQYVDDTIVMFRGNIDMAMNIKILLFLFEEMAKRKFNFKK
jgi:hypothetical protein